MTDTLSYDWGEGIDERWSWVLSHLPAIGKDSRNEQQGFNYRSIDTVLNHLKPLLSAASVHIIPVRQTFERGSYTTGRGTVMQTCTVTSTWQVRSASGDFFEAETVGEGADAGDKATSKAQTMAFKYLLWPALAIASNDDPDGGSVEGEGIPGPTRTEQAARVSHGESGKQTEHGQSGGTRTDTAPASRGSNNGREVWPISEGQKKAFWAMSGGGQNWNPNRVCLAVYNKQEDELTWKEAKQLLTDISEGRFDPRNPVPTAGAEAVAAAFPGAEVVSRVPGDEPF